MNSHLESCLPTSVVDSVKGKRFGGLQVAIAHLEGEFIKEADRVMSGSSGFADSLSDVQSVLQYHNQQIQHRSLDRERLDLTSLSEKFLRGPDAVRNLQEWVTAVERHQEKAALRLALLVRVSLAAGMGRLAIWLAS